MLQEAIEAILKELIRIRESIERQEAVMMEIKSRNEGFQKEAEVGLSTLLEAVPPELREGLNNAIRRTR